MELRSAYTPMVVVDGTSAGVGASVGAVRGLVEQARKSSRGDEGVHVAVEASDRQLHDEAEAEDPVVTVSAWSSSQRTSTSVLDIWVLYFDPQDRDVDIRRGENRGRILPHRNVVRHMRRVGQMQIDATHEEEAVFVIEDEAEARKAGLKGVVLAQDGIGGRVVGTVLL